MFKVLKSVATLGFAFACGVAAAAPAELISNGGFETGTLAGWTTSGLGTTGTCPSVGRDWNVSNSGDATGCLAAGNPTGSAFAAYVMNDGGVTNTVYKLSQSFVVPTGVISAALGWSDSSVSSYSGDARKFTVDILDGVTVVANIYNYSVPFSDSDTGWDVRTFDITSLLAAHGGETLTLLFSNTIAQVWTGPAGLGLDDVTLTADAVAAIPEPGVLALFGLALFGLGFSKRRIRK